MTHNEISAMYRGVLNAVGVDVTQMRPAGAKRHWDRCIYRFAHRHDGMPRRRVLAPLLRNAAYYLFSDPSVK